MAPPGRSSWKDREDSTGPSSPRWARSPAASWPATRASLTMRAVLARTDAPSVSSAILASSHGVSAGPCTLRDVGVGDRALDRGPGNVLGECRLPRHRHAHQHAAPQPEAQVDPDELGRGGRRPRRHGAPRCRTSARRTRAARPGRPRSTGTPRVSRYSSVAGTSRIAFGPAHTTAIGGPAELLEVGRDVERGRSRAGPSQRAAVHAADPAGREDPDPGRMGRDHRRGHRRRGPAALGQGHGKARTGGLADRSGGRRRERLERRRVQAHEQRPVADRDGGRHGAVGLAHGRLGRRRDLEVLRVRQPVADERRLERDDGPALGERGGDLGGDDQPVGHGTRDGHVRSVPSPLPCEPCQPVRPAPHARAPDPSRRRPMTPADLRRVVVVEELDLSIDGRLAIVVNRSIQGDRYHGHLYAIDRSTAATSDGRGSSPAASCATRGHGSPRTATRSRSSAATRLTTTSPAALVDPRPRRVRSAFAVRRPATTAPSARWPGRRTGRRLAFTAEVDPPRFLVGPVPPIGRRPRQGAKSAASETPSPLARRITRTDWRWDGEGHSTAGRTCSSSIARGASRAR